MDLNLLRPGDRVRTVDGTVAEIVKGTQDGKWILVRYVKSPEQPDLVGTEDLCSDDELVEVVRA